MSSHDKNMVINTAVKSGYFVKYIQYFRRLMFDFLLDFISISKNAQKHLILAVPTLNTLTTRETNKTCQ